MVLFFYVISQNPVIKGSCGCMGWTPYGKSYSSRCGGDRHRGSGDVMVLVLSRDLARSRAERVK